MTLLTKPWKVDRRGHRFYVYAPGEVCIDLCSGTEADRERVMVLLGHVQALVETLLLQGITRMDGVRCWCPDKKTHDASPSFACDEARRVLRDAGASDPDGRGDG